MRRFATAALLAVAIVAGALAPAFGQFRANVGGGSVTVVRGGGVPVVGWYAMGSVVCAAISPMVGTVMLGREMTLSEVYHSTFGCVLGPVGWLIADWLVPPNGVTPGRPRRSHGGAPRRGGHGGGRNIDVPPPGETRFVPNEVLVEFRGSASSTQIDRMAQSLQLTQLEQQRFSLTGRTLQRWRIDGARSVRATLLAMRRFGSVVAAQPNWLYVGAQGQAASAPPNVPQYVVGKLHLTEAHRITDGDDVLVAVIDSQIDTRHPDLAGVFAGEYDALGTQAVPHAHGTAMAGAIAAHSKLVGVAPKVRLLAVRAFTGSGASAQGTTFNVLKGLDWAAGKNARIVNMSFAGPGDSMLRDMLARAYARGMVLIAAVGNAGPRAPPLYPAAYRDVIGVTAADIDDKLLAQANRGPQVTFAAPGVAVIEPAPGNSYQVTSGTSVAAAHASGVAALLLARDRKLSPAAVRRIMIKGAHRIAGTRRDVGAGEIDALGALKQMAP